MTDSRVTPEQKNSRVGTTRRVVAEVAIVHLSSASTSTVWRALSEWMPLYSLSAYALVLSAGTLSFSVQLRTEAPSLSRDTLVMSAAARMRLVLQSLRMHLSLYGVDIDRVQQVDSQLADARVAAS